MNTPDAPFEAPWQAQVFAMTVALNEAGLFEWSEWAGLLGAELQGAAADGSDYYDRWVMALQRMLAAKVGTLPEEVDRIAQAWARAAHATPHGTPIRLENDPQSTASA